MCVILSPVIAQQGRDSELPLFAFSEKHNGYDATTSVVVGEEAVSP